MPREPSAKHDSGHYYPSSPDSPTYPHSHSASLSYMDPQQIVPVIQDPVPKKKHVCPTCDRTFTTSGHLARHARVHTGEKNHQCPFPNCKTRCSRQDNLQQHYRIHLSPGSRRRSTAASRTAMIRSYSGDQPASAKRGSQPTLSAQLPPINYPSPPPPIPSPPIDPPALEQAYSHMPPGPDSPPPLVQASRPTPYDAESPSSRSPSPPEYVPALVQAASDYLPVANYHIGLPHAQYGDGTSAYPDQSQGALYAYENGPSQSQPSAVDGSTVHANNGIQEQQPYAYTNSHHFTQQQHMTTSPVEHVQHIDNGHASSSPPPIQFSPGTSRHSISHISHSHGYSHAAAAHPYPPASVPPSPASARSGSSHASLASGPHTPTYTYQDEVDEPNGYHTTTEAGFDPISDASCISAGYYDPHGELVTNSYVSQLANDAHASYSSRYHSSPPILAPAPPAQERLVHAGEMQHHPHGGAPAHHPSSSTCLPISAPTAPSQLSPYLHHPRPVSGTPQYHHLPHLSLHPADWGKAHAAIPAIHN